jgi:hypothetical protein
MSTFVQKASRGGHLDKLPMNLRSTRSRFEVHPGPKYRGKIEKYYSRLSNLAKCTVSTWDADNQCPVFDQGERKENNDAWSRDNLTELIGFDRGNQR